MLTECRLNRDKPLPIKQDYLGYNTTKQITQNDGVVVYVNKSLQHQVKEIFLADASCLQISLSDCTILCIYRSPSNSNTSNFISSLDLHLKDNHLGKNVVITGDLNINIILQNTSTTNYLTMLASHGLLPAHRLNTRINSCLDHIMINLDPKYYFTKTAVLETTITDHTMTLLNIYSHRTIPSKTRTKTVTDFSSALDKLRESNLAELLNNKDPNTLVNILLDRIQNALVTNTKIVKIPCSKRTLKPWITPGVLKCIQNRNKLQKKLRLDNTNEILKITYRRYRNYCNNLIKKLKQKYERDLLSKAKNNNKTLWDTIKSITNLSKIKTKNQELLRLSSSPLLSANIVNKHFVNIGKQLAEQIPNNTKEKNGELSTYLNSIHSQDTSIGIIEPDLAEIESILLNLKSNSAAGWDNISATFLKLAKAELIPVLGHLSTLCFSQGIFPTPLKLSIIHPIYKDGDRNDVNNYRPISILTSISKIMEKIINKRLINYFNKFHLLSNRQFGFREGKSTEEAVLELTNLITKHLEGNKKTLCIFLDLKKAFDTVSVPILIRKLEIMGIRGQFLNLITSYLTNRVQRVKLNDDVFSSDEPSTLFGIPQGSVLGPTLFLTYINDLTDIRLNKGMVISYADDTALIFHGDSWAEVHSTAEAGLASVIKWLQTNLLTLNLKKTNYITFSISNKSQPDKTYTLKAHTCSNRYSNNCNCSTLNQVFSTKYLGVHIDQLLSWHKHIEVTANRIRKLIWLFKYLRHISDKELLIYIYKTLVQSIVLYCLPIWGGSHKTKIITLERAQRSILKVLLCKKITHSTTDVYREADVLTVRQLYILNCILKIHKTIKIDPCILQKRNPYSVIKQPIIRTSFAKRQFYSISIYLYNKVNRTVNIYTKTYRECKKNITVWLKEKNYEETELLLI